EQMERVYQCVRDIYPSQDRWADIFAPLLDKAQARFNQGEIEEGINSLDMVIAEIKRFSANLFVKAATQETSPEQVWNLLEIANRKDPSSAQIALKLAEISIKLVSEHLKSAQPDYKNFAFWLNTSLEALKNLKVSNSETDKWRAALLFYRAVVLWNQNKRKEAASIALECVRLDPSFGDNETIRQINPHIKPQSPLSKSDTSSPEPGKNAPCPCGSKKKYKNCCLSKNK
ncbi:MAG: SEC-C metal-binding domain-containing protein, partial [Calditrichota bacterium]